MKNGPSCVAATLLNHCCVFSVTIRLHSTSRFLQNTRLPHQNRCACECAGGEVT